MTLNDQSRWQRRQEMITAPLGEELAVLDLPNNSYLGFNATAAHAWRLLAEPLTCAELCDAMSREFEVEPAHCAKEVAALLERLAAAGLIRRV
jgi:hypothetical protein